MQYRLWTVYSSLVGSLLLAGVSPATGQVSAEPVSGAAASQPAASQIAFDRAAVRKLISTMGDNNAVAAANAALELKMLARQGMPVWQALEPGDRASARGLLNWLKDHPGSLHRPSPLRPQLEGMSLFIKDKKTGEARKMGESDLVQYYSLAQELIRDGDPYGYWAMLDVVRTATEVLGRSADSVTFNRAISFLDLHLKTHLTMDNLSTWKGYWSKPMTQPRAFEHPYYLGLGTQPKPPEKLWKVPTRLLLQDLDTAQAELERRGLWLTPSWETQYTSKNSTAELLEGLKSQSFPTRQHIGRLLRDRLDDPAAREAVSQAIRNEHPEQRHLKLLLSSTDMLPYRDALRRAWPRELTEQAPGLLEDITSSNQRRQIEGVHVLVCTLPFWPDRQWANHTALRLSEAAGLGATELSVVLLCMSDEKESVDKLLSVYQQSNLPPLTYSMLHDWVRSASQGFRDQCADRDLAGMMIRLSAASQPGGSSQPASALSTIDTSQQNWSKTLRMSYDFLWWRLNKGNLEWNEKTHRLEVPAGKLVRLKEAQIVEAYKNYGAEMQRYLDAINVKYERGQSAQAEPQAAQ